MTKRDPGKFERRKQDKYYTPQEAVVPLVPHLVMPGIYRGKPPLLRSFVEPCAGDGRLIRHLEAEGLKCLYSLDIAPESKLITTGDALQLRPVQVSHVDAIITNPPWTRDLLHPMIDHFADMKPTWLLFDSDWAYTKQAESYLEYCHKIVAVGRVKWIEGSNNTGLDNVSWYLFDKHNKFMQTTRTHFYGK